MSSGHPLEAAAVYHADLKGGPAECIAHDDAGDSPEWGSVAGVVCPGPSWFIQFP
ncbi:hypothetical protein GCM10009849_18070 [Sinomonas flava]|uniref:Uncharacterized protein n=1 Tax=Sinomonas flava TaxID=496857 RepID=A0ABN3BUI4_9MICC